MARRRLNSQTPRVMTGTEHSSKTEKAPDEMEATRSGGKTAICCFFGIFISYFIYGLLQEKMCVGCLCVMFQSIMSDPLCS